jgi:hypothetical protein
MIKKIKNKLYDIESKVSGNFIAPIEISAPGDTLAIPTVLRHSTLVKLNTSDPITLVNAEMQSLELCYADLLRLSTVFYNSREYQLKNLKQRYDLLRLRKQGLTGLGLGVKSAAIQLNDKKLLVAGNTYEFVNSGITAKPTKIELVSPKTFGISTDSNIVVGDSRNKILNSIADSIFSSNQNDLFSVHRRDGTNLSLIMFFEFKKKKEIINELAIKLIEKPGQEVKIALYDIESQELVYSGLYSPEPIVFEKPVKTSGLEMIITSTAIQGNQLDIIEIAFYRKTFRNSLGNSTYGLKATTVNMPSFSGKYLTLEDVTLQYPSHKSLLNFEVKSNNEKLFALKDEEQLSGPYIDPNFEFTCTLKDPNTLLEYLGDLEYEKCRIDQINDSYRLFSSIMTEDAYKITRNIPGNEEENLVLFPLNIKNFESFFVVKVNGERYSQIAESDTYDGKTYKVIFTGDGYVLKFKSLVQNSEILINLNGCPSYVERVENDYKIVFPWLGLGTTIAFDYPATQVLTSKVIDSSSSIMNLDYKNIIKLSINNAAFTEKPLGAVLGVNNYSVDYANGFLYRGTNITGRASIVHFKSRMHSTKLLHDTYSIKIPKIEQSERRDNSGISILNVNSSIGNLSKVNFSSYHKDNVLKVNVNTELNYIQLPPALSLLRGSVVLVGDSSKKEMLFYNGIDELNDESKVFVYYDYVGQANSLHQYKIRHQSRIPGNLFSSKIEIQDVYFSNRKTFRHEILNEGDYYFESDTVVSLLGGSLFIKLDQKPPSSIPVTITTTEAENTFSVDYLHNRIYTNSLSTFTGNIKFSYTSLLLKDFEVAIEVNKKEIWNPNEYGVIASNQKDLSELLPYFSPVIKSFSIGIIG